MWFLYAVLGWSAFVGLAVMVALFPVPAWVASLTNTVTKRKMEATDARVQNVTESESHLTSRNAQYLLMAHPGPVMSILRMAKLFGWESRVKEFVAEKREEELKWIWKRKLLNMFSNVAKCVIN